MEELILRLLDGLSGPAGQSAILAALNREAEQPITGERFDAAVLRLQTASQISVRHDGGRTLLSLRNDTASAPPWPIYREVDFEPYVEAYLWRNFQSAFSHASHDGASVLLQNTARGGPTDGVWKRPDITAAVVSRYHFAPAPELELIGFELKMPRECRVQSVHEALSHTAHVHYSYLVIYLPSGATPEGGLRQVTLQAQLHGVGLITVSDPRNDSGFSIVLEAQRREPTRARIDEFIGARLHRTNQLALQGWLGMRR